MQINNIELIKILDKYIPNYRNTLFPNLKLAGSGLNMKSLVLLMYELDTTFKLRKPLRRIKYIDNLYDLLRFYDYENN
jgi:hypothetical protein